MNVVYPALSDSLSQLQSALVSVLRGCSSADEQCRKLINKSNCAESLQEWNAAHHLLKLAVKDGALHPFAEVDKKLYFWKDQLYCTAPDQHITNQDDKNMIFKCLREAYELGLIDSLDAYVQGIHIMETVKEEIFVLKRCSVLLLGQVISLEATLKDLRLAFKKYRERQIYSNLVGIALQLIPLAGGALSKAVMVGAEIVGNLSAADVIEYTLSSAANMLLPEEFTKIAERRQEEIESVFTEYGYTKEQVRILLRGREKWERSGTIDADSAAEQDHEDKRDCERDEIQEEIRTDEVEGVRRIEDEEMAQSWASHILGTRKDEEELRRRLVSCLLGFMENEGVSAASLGCGSL